MKRTFAWRDEHLIELSHSVDQLHYVQDDIEEFRSPDGTRIRGRSQWREHLKRTDTVEMGHSDIQASQREWTKKRANFKAKIQHPDVKEATPPGEIRPMERSEITKETLNRLEGRPTPDRKTLIKLTLDIAKDFARRH